MCWSGCETLPKPKSKSNEKQCGLLTALSDQPAVTPSIGVFGRMVHRADVIFSTDCQLLKILLTQQLLPTQGMRDQRNLREMFHGFHSHIGKQQVLSIGDDSVIGHQNSIVFGDQRRERAR